MTYFTYVPLQEQTLFDVALQYYGSTEGVAMIIDDNPSCIDEAGIMQNIPLLIRHNAALVPEVVAGYGTYIPVTEFLATDDTVLIDDNDDYLIDDNNSYLKDEQI